MSMERNNGKVVLCIFQQKYLQNSKCILKILQVFVNNKNLQNIHLYFRENNDIKIHFNDQNHTKCNKLLEKSGWFKKKQ